MEEKGNRKRKPLSDITNTYNLIPTPALRNLVGATANSSSHSKPRPSNLKSSSVSSNQKLCSESSNRSDTSIGSSNVGGAAWSSRTVQLRTPPRAVSSIARAGDRRSKDGCYNQKQKTEEITKERDAAVLVASPTFVKKRKTEGGTSSVPFSSSLPYTTKDNKNEFLDPSRLLEREKQKGSAYGNLLNGLVEMPKESSKSRVDSYSHPYGKTKRLKGITYDSNFSLEKTVDGKKSGSSSDGKEGGFKQSGSSIVKIKETGDESVDPLSSLVEERTKEKEKPLNPVDTSIERTREKGKAIMHLPEVLEPTKSKGSSAAAKVNTRPPRKNSAKRKSDDGFSSCPPMKRIDLDKVGDLNSSKSWTDAHPKSKKKWLSVNDPTELPMEFVRQQNAYFKEIDDFKLPEEEISDEELD